MNTVFRSGLCIAFLTLCASCSSQKNYEVDYFKDGVFLNAKKRKVKRNFFSYLWMRMQTKSAQWPEEVALQASIPRPKDRSEKLKIHYINHSTFLVQVDNLNILTDPIFSRRASPVSWAGPKRVIAPGLQLEQVPKIDLVVISHDHYDHLDLPSLKKIHTRDRPQIFLGLGAGHVLEGLNFKEMKWWESASYKGLEIVFTPAQHFSGRTLFDRNSTLWGSFIIKSKSVAFYFGGDTGYSDHFKHIAARYPKIDFALLPVGAYAPRKFMQYNHMNPEDALRAHDELNSPFSLGMHWGTFKLTIEPREEPRERILKSGVKNFLVPENGDCFEKAQAPEQGLAKCRPKEITTHSNKKL